VPDVLLSGDHKKIADWRRAEGERLTREGGTRHAPSIAQESPHAAAQGSEQKTSEPNA
jgi:tRNA G37 N-methylase TrmD